MGSLQIPTTSPISCTFCGGLATKRSRLGLIRRQPPTCSSALRRRIRSLDTNGWPTKHRVEIWSFGGEGLGKDVILVKERKRRRSSVLVRANQGFNFNGGGGWDKNTTSRVLGNLALAIGLAYLTMTGQLGWLLDAIVSIWILAVLLPIVGLGAFFWFVGRDIVQSSCPNCGNDSKY